jgi:hypothetical protein
MSSRLWADRMFMAESLGERHEGNAACPHSGGSEQALFHMLNRLLPTAPRPKGAHAACGVGPKQRFAAPRTQKSVTLHS